MNSGTARWMSPELLLPEQFGFEKSRRTTESDCYALGMVIYEVLSGQPPLAHYNNCYVSGKIVDGERPERPSGQERVWFTDDLWGVLERCWSPKPKDRPTVEAVLDCLTRASATWYQLPPGLGHDTQANANDKSHSALSNSCMLFHCTYILALSFRYPFQRIQQPQKVAEEPRHRRKIINVDRRIRRQITTKVSLRY